MNDRISRLMDGELDDVEFESCYAELKAKDATGAWHTYHVIGDHLRGTGASPAGGTDFMARMSAALAAEPTVLAPSASKHRKTQPAALAWAVAATLAAVTVVGYTAFSTMEVTPSGIAKAREAATLRAASVRAPTTNVAAANSVPNEYLLAHQEFSPLALQAGAPYLRSASATVPAGTE